MNLEFDIGSDQIDGARDYQEDAYMVSQLGSTPAGKSAALVIMADGMGGHAAGNVASNMVVATFNKYFQSKFPPKSAPDALQKALQASNEQIASSVSETPALAGMGCTMVTAYLEGEDLFWVSVGDSHLYLIRDKELIKQNADHSYGAFLDMMIAQGEEVDEDSGMSRNMLMSAMTGAEISSIDCPETSIKVKPGDRLIIASDGLDTIGNGAITQYSSWSDTAKECVYALLKAVEDVKRKNQDNTTIIVVDVYKTEEKNKFKPQLSAAENDSAPKNTRLTDAEIVEDDESHSNHFLGVVFFIVILAAGGYFAWTLGYVDKAMTLIAEMTTNQIDESHVIVTPIPETKPTLKAEPKPVVTPPVVKKAPVYEAPRKPPSRQIKEITYKPFNDKLKRGGKAPSMIQVPAGNFRMGSPSAISRDEAPKHTVEIKSFAISTHEITFAEYEIFAKANKKPIPQSNGWNKAKHPVIEVSWNNAFEYSQWLGAQTGKKYRLPTESEWEYAARGGTLSKFWWGKTQGTANAMCFNCETDLNQNKPSKIGIFKANPFGLYDVHGNVFEWVHDCYHKNYNNAPTDGSNWEGGDCSVRVARGGAFRSPASSMRSSNREKFPSNKGQYHLGIRLARDI